MELRTNRRPRQAQNQLPFGNNPQASEKYRETAEENSPSIGHNSGYSAGNWIAICRDIEKHPIVGFGQTVKPADPKRGSYSRAEAWQSLLFLAQYRPAEVENKGRVILLNRGQLMGGLQFLADKWNWTVEAVRWFLRKLEQASMAVATQPTPANHPKRNTTSKTNTVKVLTICNYDIYQVVSEISERLDAMQNPKPTPSAPQESNNYSDSRGASEVAEGDRVEVNGEAIYLHFGGKKKRIPYSTIDLWAVNARIADMQRARNIVQGVLEGWVADGKLPDKPGDTLQRALRYTHIDDEVGQQRITNERQRAVGRGGKFASPQVDDGSLAARARGVGMSVEEFKAALENAGQPA